MVRPVSGSNSPNSLNLESSKIVEAVRMGKIAGETKAIGSYILSGQMQREAGVKGDRTIEIKQIVTTTASNLSRKVVLPILNSLSKTLTPFDTRRATGA